MREYETAVVVQPELSDEGLRDLCARMNDVLEKNFAHRLGLDDQGKRKLAYEIRKFQKGHYLYLSYLDEGLAVPDLERILRLDESVLRFLTLQVNPDVKDIEARKAEAADLERIREQKAAERTAREAEEARARADEARARAEAAASETASAAAALAEGEAGDEASVDAGGELERGEAEQTGGAGALDADEQDKMPTEEEG